MGLILSKFRKKLTTSEQLKQIEDSLRKIEDYKKSTERAQKKTIANVVIYSAALYIISCVVVFVWYLPESWIVRLALLVPLVLVPVIIYWTKRLISRYFNSKMVKANEEYEDLQKKKKDIIDNVMETETFNKAKEILSKYAPEKLGKVKEQEVKLPQSVNLKNSNSDLRKRNNSPTTAASMSTALRPASPPRNSFTKSGDLRLLPQRALDSTLRQLHGSMPRPVLPKDRNFADKLVEYIIGDGPSNRYALICQFCNGHNGMALKEEFMYMAFNCCYCMNFNAARLRRPLAPKLPEPPKTLALPSPDAKTSNIQPQELIGEGFEANTSDVEENLSAEESELRSKPSESECVEPQHEPDSDDVKTLPSEHQVAYLTPIEEEMVKNFNKIVHSMKGEREEKETEVQEGNADIFAPEEHLNGEKQDHPNTSEETQNGADELSNAN